MKIVFADPRILIKRSFTFDICNELVLNQLIDLGANVLLPKTAPRESPDQLQIKTGFWRQLASYRP